MSAEEHAVTKEEQLENMLSHIEDLMAEEQYEKALGVLNYALKLDLFDLRVYERYSFVLRMLGNAEGAELFEKVVMKPGDAEGYYAIAQTLISDKLFGSAINPLKKVVEFVPMAANATFELAYSFLKEFEVETAVEYFDHAYDLSPSPHTAFYVAYSNLLLGNLEKCKSLIPYIEDEYNKHQEQFPVMLIILKEMVERYEAFPPQDLRDWHFVQYGTPLLRLSDEELGQKVDTLNGRFVFINYGMLNVATALQAFKRLVEEVPAFPKYEYIIPASYRVAPIAFALSEMLEIPLVNPDAMESDFPGLMVTGWTDEVEAVSKHLIDNPAVTLFSFSMGWTQQATLCPEVIGFMDQANRLPWEETVEVMPDGSRQHRPAMTVPPEVVGHAILDRLEATPTEEIDKLVEYYKARSHLLKVGENINNPRLGFQIESPILSARMMV
ncbi:MAG: tetratricopeptide repeat protein [Tumebacillaceae bacterium]